jgi:hypothetical protein
MGIKIIRTRKVKEEAPRHGAGWPVTPGFPYNQEKTGYHSVEIRGLGYALLWKAGEAMWSSGLSRYSPEVLAKYDYRGECSIIYRAPPSLVKKVWRRG